MHALPRARMFNRFLPTKALAASLLERASALSSQCCRHHRPPGAIESSEQPHIYTKKPLHRRDAVLDLPTIAQHSRRRPAQGALQINSWISNRSPLTDATKAVRRDHCCSEDFPPQPTPELAHLAGAALSSGATRGFVGKGNDIKRIPLALHDSVRPKPINAA